MQRGLVIAAVVAVAGIGIAAVRPGELPMFQMLNGQPIRWTMTDGGESGLYGTPPQCAPLAGSGGATGITAQVIKLTPDVPVNLCVRPALGANVPGTGVGWDGGCSNVVGNPNFGDPLQPNQAHYVLLSGDPQATYICAHSDAGTVATAIFRMY